MTLAIAVRVAATVRLSDEVSTLSRPRVEQVGGVTVADEEALRERFSEVRAD